MGGYRMQDLTTRAAGSKRTSTFALLALAISAFAIGTTEFVIVGLLPSVAADLHISLTLTGLLISGYALGVAVGAPVLTILTAQMSRKRLLLMVVAIFIIGNGIAALAPTFMILMLGRIVAAFAHGVFFSIGATIAADLVSPDRRGSAIAMVFTGLTIALITGVPLGTFIGQHWGWRATFYGVASLGAIAFVANEVLVPRHLKKAPAASLRDQIKVIQHGRLLLAFAITALGYGGTFVAFTYLAPILQNITGFAPEATSILMLVYGLAIAIGNTAGGKLSDRNPIQALIYMFAMQGLVLVLFTFTAPFKVPAVATLFMMGALAFMNVPGLQLYVVQLAERFVPGGVDIASAINISAFNLGIALGAFMDGIIFDNLGLIHTPWIGGVMVGAAVGLSLLSRHLDRKEQAEPNEIPESDVDFVGECQES
jgi:predicted MFS family arabinose efflux permease